eukprot:s2333_g5.t1
MQRFRQTPWKCRFCKRLNKAAATFCGQCGRHWADALDGSYTHPQRSGSQRGGSQQNWTYSQWTDETPWANQTWDNGRRPSQSPRHGPRSQTPKGKQSKKKRKDKKQMEQHQAPPLPTSPWTGNAGGKGNALSSAPMSPANENKNEPKSDQKLRQTWVALKKNESSLSPELQQLVQETIMVQSQDVTRQLYSAVSRLEQAKKTLQYLRASRQNLHNVWKNYIEESVSRWKAFCEQFDTQDKDLSRQLQEALTNVQLAQTGLEISKKEAKEGEQSEGTEVNMVEVSDDDGAENLEANGVLLRQGMGDMLKSLESLKHHAESMAEPESAQHLQKLLEPLHPHCSKLLLSLLVCPVNADGTAFWGAHPRDLPDWWRNLIEIQEYHGVTELLEEGPVIYVNTWYSQAIDMVPARLQCSIRTCFVQLGHLPLLDDQARRPGDFTSVVVEVFPMEDDVDDFTSFFAAGSRVRNVPSSPPLTNLPTVARQPDDFGDPDTDEEDDEPSSFCEDEAWKNTVVFSVRTPPVHCSMNWVNPELQAREAAQALQLERQEVEAVHPIRWPPADLSANGEHGVLVRHRDDLPACSHQCFVLVDVDFHPRAPARIPESVRSPIYLPHYMTRGMILRAMNLAVYCQYVQDKCIVWHNGVTFRSEEPVYIHLHHGDHIHVAVPPPEDDIQRVPTRCVARIFQLDIEPEHAEAFYMVSDVDNDLDDMPTRFAVVDVTSSDYGSDRGPYTDPETEDDTMQLQQLSVCRDNVWYNDHVRVPLCDAARAVRLYDDVVEWRFLMARAWQEQIDLFFYLVVPHPVEDTSGAVAHVLLLQRPLPEFRSVIVSVKDSNVFNGIPRRWTLMVPTGIGRQIMVNVMGYQPYCFTGGAVCRLFHREYEIPDIVQFITEHGMSLVLWVHHQEGIAQDEDSSEATALLQPRVDRIAQDVVRSTTAVRLFSTADFLQLPAYVEIPEPFAELNIEQELLAWGHSCTCWLVTESAVAVCWPRALPRPPEKQLYLYMPIDHLVLRPCACSSGCDP